MRFTALALGATLLAACSHTPQLPPTRPKLTRYVLQGTIRDAMTARPVSGVYIWPIFQSWGVLTDSAGRYRLEWVNPAFMTFLIRRCTEENLGHLGVDFRTELLIERDVTIFANPGPCPNHVRPPWQVDASDTTLFQGHYIYSWEGGGWLEDCDNRTYHVDWDSPLDAALRDRRQQEGQVTFLRLRGRIAEDHLGVVFPGPLFLVDRVEEARDPRDADCG